MTNSIEIAGLCKAYDSFALEDVSFTLPCGTIMGLIGENGAGKSTTIKSILNMISHDAGEITLLGRDSRDPAARREVGVVLDECPFHDALRPRELEKVLRPLFPTWDRDLFAHYLEKFSLPADQKIKEFSRGMKMKLSLTAALAHRPKLLILDEATSGLDPVVRDEILDEFLSFIQEEDHSILLSTHITSDLEKAADYITYIHQGRVRFSQEKDRLLETYGRLACTAKQLDAVDPALLLGVRREQFGCEALVADRAAFARRYPALAVESVTLEQIMVLYGKGDAA